MMYYPVTKSWGRNVVYSRDTVVVQEVYKPGDAWLEVKVDNVQVMESHGWKRGDKVRVTIMVERI